MSKHVIETRGLTVYYGRHRGILNVDLSVKQGEIFGFLGPNGAGKTTTQRVLVDVIRPSKGSATIFGLDCQKDGVAIRQRIGYLPGEQSLPEGMTARQYFKMLAAIRGSRNRAYEQELCQRLDLNPNRKMREYSRGNKQKVGLVAALMHKPDLLILDEPTSGLDPLVQQTVLELVREAQANGRSVFFSSHILPEVQAVCDRVGIIREGQLVATESVGTLTKQQFRRVKLTFNQMPPPDTFALEGVTETARNEHTILLEVHQNIGQVLEAAVPYGILDIETPPVTLEEIFLAYYGRRSTNGGNHV